MKNKGKVSIKEIISLIKSKKFIFATTVLLISYALTYLTSIFLMNEYGNNLPILNDLILDNIPYLKIAFLYDFLIIISIITFAISAIMYDLKKVPYFILVFAISYFVRAIFIILTPFGSPNGDEIGIFSSVGDVFGMYPSGHTMATVLAFAFSKGAFRKINFILLILIPLSLLLGRGHYSIDIFSGLLFGYAIYTFGEKHIKQLIEGNIKS